MAEDCTVFNSTESFWNKGTYRVKKELDSMFKMGIPISVVGHWLDVNFGYWD